MTKETQRKLEEADQAYRANRLKLENYLEEISTDNRKFQEYLENVSEQMTMTLRHYEEGHQVDRSQIYFFLERESETSIQHSRSIQRQLEDRLEENQALYGKKVRQYKEEALLAKKEAKKYV
ncbi:hypothetical protein ACSFB8_04760 [Enterococcus faecalis]